MPYSIPAIQSKQPLRCPTDFAGKTTALMLNLVQRQKHFGEWMRLSWDTLTGLAFGANDVEGRAILECLVEDGLVREQSVTNASTTVVVTSSGIRAHESGKLGLPATVFISSTCYDLIDLRYELAAELESRGSVVKLSEDPQRFAVDPNANSIQTCIANLESSDVVVCIIDRRYGGILGGDFGELSATHFEVNHAQRMDPPKPMFFFMRERAWMDYGLLKGNPSAETQWVEPKNSTAKTKWLDFVRQIAAIPSHANRSNWVTLFRSSADLRPLVVKRLNEWR